MSAADAQSAALGDLDRGWAFTTLPFGTDEFSVFTVRKAAPPVRPAREVSDFKDLFVFAVALWARPWLYHQYEPLAVAMFGNPIACAER
jgi:hypothetical protein